MGIGHGHRSLIPSHTQLLMPMEIPIGIPMAIPIPMAALVIAL